MRVTTMFKEFLQSERASGIILIFCTIISLLLANSAFGADYLALWKITRYGHTIGEWINDGLMTFFFLLVGLELEREFMIGELSDKRKAMFPVLAALGGMLIPALIHFLFNHGTPTQSGVGIPMATDIAFSLGILSLVGAGVPPSLKIFLTALAIADDLGAIVVIAVFYNTGIAWGYLLAATAVYLFLFMLGKLKVYVLWPYMVGGLVMWVFMHHSGVHATITGVLLAFAIPFGGKSSTSLSGKLPHDLHWPVTLFVLPVFALANTGLVIDGDWYKELPHINNYGIFLGLVVGKPLGIVLFCWLSHKFKLAPKPHGFNWKQLTGAGILAGIGFTMSIFVTLLAFSDEHIQKYSQITILIASAVAGLGGYLWFKWIAKPKKHEEAHS